MTIFYVSFGPSQHHDMRGIGKIGGNDCPYVKICAPNMAEARDTAFGLFGNKFCTVYYRKPEDAKTMPSIGDDFCYIARTAYNHGREAGLMIAAAKEKS